jgi:murein L,D-transpeptidase YcbB/YkuD
VRWLSNALVVHGYSVASPLVSTGPDGSDARASGLNDGDTFDANLDAVVRQFQRDNSLVADGVAGPRVRALLAVDDARLAAGLESWGGSIQAWAEEVRAAGYDRMIIVNIPSFTLHAIDLSGAGNDLESRVVVGKPSTRTPRMFTRVVNLKANPDWTPPPSIRNAHYQPPGPNNSLGLMRFSTDNRVNIYLHDTNARGLFNRDARALSHGCVRVQQWHALAAWAARQDETWVDEVALIGGETRYVKIPAVPVLITYSLVDMVDRHPQVFDDIYGLGDEAIGNAALDGRTEAPPRTSGVLPVRSREQPLVDF